MAFHSTALPKMARATFTLLAIVAGASPSSVSSLRHLSAVDALMLASRVEPPTCFRRLPIACWYVVFVPSFTTS
ncbi:MAG: hypothetical protein H6809_04930 [Phycisphaeraceae bacterium]|nr:hypothetical protein [Phycisphaeraceae bacterium]